MTKTGATDGSAAFCRIGRNLGVRVEFLDFDLHVLSMKKAPLGCLCVGVEQGQIARQEAPEPIWRKGMSSSAFILRRLEGLLL